MAERFLAQHAAQLWTGLLDAAASLDVLAGFAAVTAPASAPESCTFCRPTFASAQQVTQWLRSLSKSFGTSCCSECDHCVLCRQL